MGPSLLVAFLAGCGNVLLTNPIWTVATRMQARILASLRPHARLVHTLSGGIPVQCLLCTAYMPGVSGSYMYA